VRLSRHSSLSTVAACGLVAASLLLGWAGIHRSLWLDEAWVANSIAAPSLQEMFYYPEWLQSSPPLFLLGSRAAVHAMGLSNALLRIEPLVMALVAAMGMFAVSKRVLSPGFALLGCALLVFFTAEIEYSHSAKQYSGEVAATTLILLAAVAYLRTPDRSRFCWLAAAFALLLTLSYAAVFLLPGILFAVFYTSPRRGLGLACVAGAMLALLFIFFIRPNLGDQLRAYWASEPESGLSRGVLAALIAMLVVTLAGLVRARGRPGWREWTQIVCVLPCVLLAVAGAFGWYPMSYRTRLFVFPCFLLVGLMGAQDLAQWLLKDRRVVNAAAWAAMAAAVLLGIRTELRSHPYLPKEDVDGAVRFLQRTVAPSDILVVHPSVGESFRLYAAMHGWTSPPVAYGDTGWPCCPRQKISRPGISTRRAVNADLDRMIPPGYSGRAWLLYTIRPTHWNWVGLDESNVWRDRLTDRGCAMPKPYLQFENLAITLAICGPNPEREPRVLPSAKLTHAGGR
jgi:hypothetical protein